MTEKETGEGSLSVAAADGRNARELVTLGQEYVSILFPSISPDGSTVVFAADSPRTSYEGPPGGGANAEHGRPVNLFTINVADARVSLLAKLIEEEPYPAWRLRRPR